MFWLLSSSRTSSLLKDDIRVIVCRPGEEAEAVEIEETIEAMEKIIGGEMDEYTPYSFELFG